MLADVDHAERGSEAVPDTASLGEHLVEARRECSGDGDRSIRRDGHVYGSYFGARVAEGKLRRGLLDDCAAPLQLLVPLQVCRACDARFIPGVSIQSPTVISM